MARPRKSVPSIRREIYLPENIHTRLELLLFSPTEGRVPVGAWSSFFTKLAEQALDRLVANQTENSDATER